MSKIILKRTYPHLEGEILSLHLPLKRMQEVFIYLQCLLHQQNSKLETMEENLLREHQMEDRIAPLQLMEIFLPNNSFIKQIREVAVWEVTSNQMRLTDILPQMDSNLHRK